MYINYVNRTFCFFEKDHTIPYGIPGIPGEIDRYQYIFYGCNSIIDDLKVIDMEYCPNNIYHIGADWVPQFF